LQSKTLSQIYQDGNFSFMDILGDNLILPEKNTSDSDCNIFIENIKTLDARKILAHQFVCYPKWSPDGEEIAYEFYFDDHPGDIYLMNKNGDNKHKLLSSAKNPCWSADGKKIYFIRNGSLNSFDISRNLEESLIRFNTSQDGNDTVIKFPSVSDDGSKVALYAQIIDKENSWGIMIYDFNKRSILNFFKYCEAPFWIKGTDNIICNSLDIKTKRWGISILNGNIKNDIVLPANQDLNCSFPVWIK